MYEGLTDYFGDILAPRSGAISPQHYREQLALDAANMDNTTGRAWRSMETLLSPSRG